MVFKTKSAMESLKQTKKDILKDLSSDFNNEDTGFEFAPLRSLDDFLLESARFQVPQMKEIERWNNRILHNLLYYQTNYFILAIIVFLIVGMLHPVRMLYGIFAISLAFSIFAYATNQKPELIRFKSQHPVISVLFIFIMGYLCVYLLGSVLVFLAGITFPLALMFLHASLRMRNLKNKISRKIEDFGLKRTPMGMILDWLGQTDKIISMAREGKVSGIWKD